MSNSIILILLLICLVKLLPAANNISQCIIKLRFNFHTIEALYDIVNDKADGQASKHKFSPKVNTKSAHSRYLVKLNNLIVYTPIGEQLNKPINFEACTGDIILLKNESGVGKTTILDAICGLKLQYNGDIDLVTADPHADIHYSSQNGFFYDASVFQNIVMGNSDGNDAYERAMNSIIKAELASNNEEAKDVASKLVTKEKVGFQVGSSNDWHWLEYFTKIRKINILDEISSALDSNTEEQILKALVEFSSDRVIICVSHSKLLEKYATKVVEVLPHGRVKV